MLVNISDGYLRQLKATPDENPFLDVRRAKHTHTGDRPG